MWTPEIVRARFVEACDTERRLPRPHGTIGKSGYWPEVLHTFEDRVGWNKKEHQVRQLPPSAAAISRHTEVMDWTARLIEDEQKRKIVWAWAWCRMSDRSFGALCNEKGWAKVTAYRRLSSICTRIAWRLNNERTLLRMPDEKWLVHETQETGYPGTTLATPDNGAARSPHFMIFDGDRPRDTLTSPQAIADFEKHLNRVNKARKREQEQERRRKLRLVEA